MKRYLLTFAIAATTLGLCADERLPLLRAGLSTYTNVTVYSVSATDIYFSHAGGMGNAKLKDLDRKLQQHFNYSPTNAANAAQAQAQATAQYHRQVASQKPPVKRPEPREEAGRSGDEADIRAPKISAKSFLGRPAPKFVAEKWLTTEPDTAGKFVMVDFWATWCGPCRSSIPELNRYHAKFKNRLVIVGLTDETEAEVRKMKSPKMDYAVAIDTRSRMNNEAGVRGIPHAMLIDPKGIVRYEGHPGYLNESGLEKLLKKYGD